MAYSGKLRFDWCEDEIPSVVIDGIRYVDINISNSQLTTYMSNMERFIKSIISIDSMLYIPFDVYVDSICDHIFSKSCSDLDFENGMHILRTLSVVGINAVVDECCNYKEI